MKLIELFCVVAVVLLLASLSAGPTSRAYARCKFALARAHLKHTNQLNNALQDSEPRVFYIIR